MSCKKCPVNLRTKTACSKPPPDKGVALFLERAIDADGQLVDFKLTARRDAKAAKAFLNKAIERVWLHRPVSICTDKTPTYRKVKRDINQRYDPHIDKKYRNNRVESDHAALKRLLGYRQSFRSLRCAKASLQGMETIRTIKNGHIQNRQPGVQGEVAFVRRLFDLAV
ncbi:DDE-type integrase/transposase/recombinase [Ascidiaceihabitans sp.]|uniref:DDE-type integrase/transposase/recombinase n=1 Tax=Ascidiaceihabitans sp. TaxID=1872644 RepID=UPI00329790BB